MGAIAAEPISARRLDLLPLRAEHGDDMAAVLPDPADAYAFAADCPPEPEALLADYQRLIAQFGDAVVSWCTWVIHIRELGIQAGTVHAVIRTGDDPVAEVAWDVEPPWQGQGIAAEAARALVAWLARQSVRTVIAYIDPRHEGSAAVAASAGLVPTEESQDGETRWRLRMAP
jgi:RimJ/RimL family protein N-acetyltransferase